MEKKHLLEMLRVSGALMFGDFVLKSGVHSPYFLNLGTIADGSSLRILGRVYAEEVLKLPVFPDVLFGPAYKGISIAVATALILAEEFDRTVSVAYNRKEVKGHGEGGYSIGASMTGKRVVIVDDVITDGASKREAYDLIGADGGEVIGIILMLNRSEMVGETAEETALEALHRQYGIPIRCMLTSDDILTVSRGRV